MKEKIKQQIKKQKKSFIAIEEIEEMVGRELQYIEFVSIMKQIINDGTIKPVRKRVEWEGSSSFFKI